MADIRLTLPKVEKAIGPVIQVDNFTKAIRLTEPGDQHHLPELKSIEKLLHKAIGIEEFSSKLYDWLDKHIQNLQNGSPLSYEQLKSIDDFTLSYFSTKLPDVELWLVRGFIVGRMIEAAEKMPQGVQSIELNKIPGTVSSAEKTYNLLAPETRALEWIISDGAKDLVGASHDTAERVSHILSGSIKRGESHRNLQKRLEAEIIEGDGEVGRNWKRVAINETNSAFNNGYLAQLRTGNWVMGISFPDACDECASLIDGKVYPVITKDVLDKFTDNNNEWLWENAVWVGKDNVGRSRAKNKQTNEGLRPRKHEERAMPAVPFHPYCRCRFVRINPYTQFIANGTMKSAIGREAEWSKWYTKEVESRFKKLQELKIL